MFRLLAENFDDVLESVLSSLEAAILKDDSTEKLKRVEKVIVGEIAEDGSTDPYKLTFVLKGMDDCSVTDARDRYKNLHKQAV